MYWNYNLLLLEVKINLKNYDKMETDLGTEFLKY